MIDSWWDVAWASLLFGFTSWAGHRIASWQEHRSSKKRVQAIIDETAGRAEKAAEEVRRARQSGSDD